MKSDYIQGDETTVPVLDKAGHQTNKEYLWMVGAVVERLVLFHYDKGSRSGTVIGQLAKDFKGYFQCDGFEGYESAFKRTRTCALLTAWLIYAGILSRHLLKTDRWRNMP